MIGMQNREAFFMRRLALVTGLMIAASPVAAETLDDLVGRQADAVSCWQRVYDDAHLASHPDQQVTKMTFALGFQSLAGMATDRDGLFVFGMSAALRDGKRGVTSGECRQDETGIRCAVECDGGGVYISSRSDGSLLIDLEPTGYISMESECAGDGEQETFPLEPGLDDKQFLLGAIDSKLCKGIVPTQ
jgi:hypothetical protein